MKAPAPAPAKPMRSPAGPPLDYCFMDITDLTSRAQLLNISTYRSPAITLQPLQTSCLQRAALGSVEAISGHPKSQVTPELAAASSLSKSAAGSEAALQSVQQGPKAPKPGLYDHNSFAVKLSSNPITSLTGLPEGIAAVLDSPVSSYPASRLNQDLCIALHAPPTCRQHQKLSRPTFALL